MPEKLKRAFKQLGKTSKQSVVVGTESWGSWEDLGSHSSWQGRDAAQVPAVEGDL